MIMQNYVCLYNCLTEHILFFEKQFRFTAGNSAEHVLTKLIDNAYYSFDQKYAFGVLYVWCIIGILYVCKRLYLAFYITMMLS